MPVYLLHFERRYKHAGHYLGYTHDLATRLAQHRAGNGARLMEVITQAGIAWTVACVWEGGRDVEMQLKRWHSGVRLCPLCRHKAVNANSSEMSVNMMK
ncbi:MAG: endonuclease [Chloroflexi bacterium]|nr:endonuclease [Chloroflexota bacterium]